MLAVVMWSWKASCVHTACFPAPHEHSQHNEVNTSHSFIQSCSPEDGHNDA